MMLEGWIWANADVIDFVVLEAKRAEGKKEKEKKKGDE